MDTMKIMDSGSNSNEIISRPGAGVCETYQAQTNIETTMLFLFPNRSQTTIYGVQAVLNNGNISDKTFILHNEVKQRFYSLIHWHDNISWKSTVFVLETLINSFWK